MIQPPDREHPVRILVVEDDAEMRSFLSDELSDEGYDVREAGNGEEAAQVIAEEALDLIITDVRMPKVGGLDLLPHVKAAYPDLPVIVITAFGDWPILSEAYERGAVDYLDKPFKIIDLKNSIKRALQKKGGYRSCNAQDAEE